MPLKSNTTDNERAKMTAGKGTIQDYNSVASDDKIIADHQCHDISPTYFAIVLRTEY